MKYVAVEQQIFDAMKQSKDFALNEAEYEVVYGTRDTFVKFLDVKIKSLQIGLGNMEYKGEEAKIYSMIEGFDILKKELSEMQPLKSFIFAESTEEL